MKRKCIHCAEFSSCKDILFRGDYQETCSACVAHASRIIVCPLGWTEVAPRISVFSISPLKFSQSTRRADWNSHKKNVSYAPGDSSKYFRQLPFLFFPVCFPLFVPLLPHGQTRWSVLSCRVVSRPMKRSERRHGLHERYVGSYFVMPNSHMNTETDAAGQSRFHKGLKGPSYIPFIEMFCVDFDGSTNDKKTTVSNRFRNCKTSTPNIRIPS